MKLTSFLDIAPYLQNPLILAGFALFLFFGVHRILIKSGIIQPLKTRASSNILQRLLRYGFIIALAVIMLGFALEFFKVYHKTQRQINIKKISNYKNESVNELMSILEHRAQRVLKLMEEEKLKALDSIAQGKGFVGSFAFLGPLNPEKAKFLKELEASRRHFIELHRKHIAAIKAGQFVLAHEILNDIHVLLLMRYNEISGAAYLDPANRYSLMGAELPPYSYPGSLPTNISKEEKRLAAEIWDSENNNISSYERWAKLQWQVNHYHPVVAIIIIVLAFISPVLLWSLRFSKKLRQNPGNIYILRGLILIVIADLLYESQLIALPAALFLIIGIALMSYGIFLRVYRGKNEHKEK